MITNLTFPIITFTMFNILDISEGQTKIYYQLTSQKLTIMLERKYFYEANFGVKSMLKYRHVKVQDGQIYKKLEYNTRNELCSHKKGIIHSIGRIVLHHSLYLNTLYD